MTSAAPPLIELRQACKTYGTGDATVHALRNVSFTIERGEFVAITGPSGSGKSTLMNVIGGLDIVTSGSYRFGGVAIESLDKNARSRYRHTYVGFIFQGFNLLRRTTALENVELPLIYRRLPGRERRARALESLDLVGLADRAHHTASQLSGGQQQRVAIARAIACRPAVLVADEPTGNLDSVRSDEILATLSSLNKTMGTTLLIVTHEASVAERARRRLECRDGRLYSDSAEHRTDVA